MGEIASAMDDAYYLHLINRSTLRVRMSLVKNEIWFQDQLPRSGPDFRAAPTKAGMVGQLQCFGLNCIIKALGRRWILQADGGVNFQQVLACLATPQQPSGHLTLIS